MGASLVNCTNATPIPRPVGGITSTSASWLAANRGSALRIAWSILEPRARSICRRLASVGDRVTTTEGLITGIASKSFIASKPYLVKFVNGHTQHRAEVQERKR
jgi:hypothetical protein